MFYFCACSFGKDSIATVLLALQHNEPLDEVVFTEVMFDNKRGISGEDPKHIHWVKTHAAPTLESLGCKVRIIPTEIDYLDSFNQYTLSFLNKKIIIDGRLEIINSPKGKFIIDFAHTPDGVSKVLDYLNIISSGRIITVIGMGGNRDRSKRSIVGEIVSNKSDILILTSDNPRYENPIDIIEEIKKGITNNITLYVEPDRRKAIKFAYDLSTNVDIIAILGKGNEPYLIIDDMKIPYNDREEVYKLINKRGK